MKARYTAGPASAGWADLIQHYDWWEVDNIFVHPAYRKRSIGNELMQQICNDADRVDVELRLTVAGSRDAMDDDTLRRWYQRHGFTLRGRNGCELIRPQKSQREAPCPSSR